jgi:hypothetical protein
MRPPNDQVLRGRRIWSGSSCRGRTAPTSPNRHVISRRNCHTGFEGRRHLRSTNCAVLAVDETLISPRLFRRGRSVQGGLAFPATRRPEGCGLPVPISSTPTWQLGRATSQRQAKVRAADPAVAADQHSAQVDPGNSGDLLVADKTARATGWSESTPESLRATGRQLLYPALIIGFIEKAEMSHSTAATRVSLEDAAARS